MSPRPPSRAGYNSGPLAGVPLAMEVYDFALVEADELDEASLNRLHLADLPLGGANGIIEAPVDLSEEAQRRRRREADRLAEYFRREGELREQVRLGYLSARERARRGITASAVECRASSDAAIVALAALWAEKRTL